MINLNTIPNKEGGFIRAIIIVIVIICVMAYFHISFGDVINWITNAFHSVFGN